jgi:HAD superfamily hydrolase (TIGR01459 family)
MNFISGIKQISHRYDYFIFDVWGVMHDGSTLYPGALEAVSFLRQENKKICFLSNAPRRANKISGVLQNFGVTGNLYDFILSSGEATFLDLKKNQDNGFKNFGQNYFYIGPKKDIDLLEGLNYKRVEEAEQADFAITTGFDHENSTITEKLSAILEARKYNLDMICVNPDMIVVKQNGQEMICAGALAREYEKAGGKVFYYGKPFRAIYEMVCEIFNNFESNKALAIGDGIETDIKGANDFGIDSLLVTGGILSNLLNNNYEKTTEKARLETICNKYQIFPEFVIPNLKL